MAQLTDNIQLVIGNSLNLSTEHKFRMIYFDPPFNSDRDYKLNHNSDVGFSDKWTDADYEKFISKKTFKRLPWIHYMIGRMNKSWDSNSTLEQSRFLSCERIICSS